MYMAENLGRDGKKKSPAGSGGPWSLQVRIRRSSPSLQASRVARVSPPPKTNEGGPLAHGPNIPVCGRPVKRLVRLPSDDARSAELPRPRGQAGGAALRARFPVGGRGSGAGPAAREAAVQAVRVSRLPWQARDDLVRLVLRVRRQRPRPGRDAHRLA